MIEQSHRSRASVVRASVALGAATALALVAGCAPSPTPPADAVADPVVTPDATDEPTADDVDLAAFVTPTPAEWTAIVEDPAVAIGMQVLVFAEVRQFDGSTGPEAFRALVGPSQPAEKSELSTSALLTGHSDVLSELVNGDVVLVHGEVAGASEAVGDVIPELRVYAIESVGFRDLLQDVVVSAPVRAGGGVDVPIAITNSSHMAMNYTIDLVAESADGSLHLGTASAGVSYLAPGQAANTAVAFGGGLPPDAVIKLASVRRGAA